MRPLALRISLAACAFVAAACPSDERRTLLLTRVVPEVDPACGAPANARFTMVTALGDFAPGPATVITYINEEGAAFEIDTFPPTTRALEVSVIGQGGVVLTIGRTREFNISELEDQTEVAVFMAPPRGFCPTGPMAQYRASPLATRAGTGVLVAGGTDRNGDPVTDVEWYNPDLGQFLRLDGSFYGEQEFGLLGASSTALPDGRVAVVGGRDPAYQTYDPVAKSFGAPRFLESKRAHHAAAALPDGRLVLAGGCTEMLETGACDLDTATATTLILDPETGELASGPDLGAARVGASALSESDGTVLIYGGMDEGGTAVTTVERIDPSGALPTETIGEVEGTLTPLLSGGFLVGFAPGADPAAAWVVAPGSSTGSPVADPTLRRDGATLTGLEDGKVFAFGGAGPGDPATLYLPFSEGFLDLEPSPGGLLAERSEHAAVRLDDGSVLILGGRDGSGLPLADGWIYRHDLTGPLTSAVEISLGFGTARQAELMSPRDPARAAWVPASNGRPAHYRVEGSGSDGNAVSGWVIAAGPRFVNPRITTRLGLDSATGGVALMLGYEDPARYYYVELMPGETVRLLRLARDMPEPEIVCSGDALDADALVTADTAPMIQAQVTSESVGVWREGERLLDCDPGDPVARGWVGVGVIGDADAAVVIDELAVYR